MTISAIKTMVFSPTGTSKKIAQAIAEGAQTSQTIEHVNLTLPEHSTDVKVGENELAIIAVPVYVGRVAPLAAKRLKEISGKNSPAILVVLYGNREFEDALIELKNIALAQSFSVVAAAAFIGEHSFSTVAKPTAHGRPDKNDLAIAHDLGKKLMQSLNTGKATTTVEVPGDTPYKDGMKNLPFTPTITIEKCNNCEECVAVCPAGAISIAREIQISADSCTFCCACIKVCPEECISLAATPMEEKTYWLHTNCQERKEPQLFF